MDGPPLKAQHYRDQAIRFRKLAAMDDSEVTRNALIDLADSYDKLAQRFIMLASSQKMAVPWSAIQ